MSRCRKISTDISMDSRVNQLSDFAALLYTWSIPHCNDDCQFSARNSKELQLMVVPGRNRATDEVEMAIEELKNAGLMGQMENGHFYLPSESFYKYQTYINSNKRQETPRISASPSPSPSPSLNSLNPPIIPLSGDPKKQKGGSKKKEPLKSMPKDFAVTDEHRTWAETKGYRSPDLLFEAFRDYHLGRGSKFSDWDAVLRTWVRNDTEKFGNRNGAADHKELTIWDTPLKDQPRD